MSAADKLLARQREFASEVAMLKHKAGTLEMYATMQALEAGVKAVGWEVERKIKAAAKVVAVIMAVAVFAGCVPPNYRPSTTYNRYEHRWEQWER